MKTTIKEVELKSLTETKNNPRQISKKDFDILKKSLKEFPEMQEIREIVVDENMTILGGHQRVKAMMANGQKTATVKIVEGLTDEQKREFIIKDNIQNGEWDMDEIANAWSDMPFDDWGLDVDWAEPKEIVEDAAPEFNESEPAKSELGKVYQLGEHRLMCGDSTSSEDVAKLMNGQKADMVFTDPPYNVAFNGRSGNFDVIENDNLSNEDFRDFISKTSSMIKKLAPKAYYVWCNWKFYGLLQENLDFKSCIVWAKNNFGLGKGYRHQHEFCLFYGDIDDDIKNETDLWEINKDANYVHPTQKPIGLCARALKNHKSYDNIVDLFGGSGSTLIACEQIGRKCFMMELDPKYCDVIRKRWVKLTTGSEDNWQELTPKEN